MDAFVSYDELAKTAAKEFERVRVLNPHIQSLWYRCKQHGVPEDVMMKIAVVFLAGQAESFKKAVLDASARKTAVNNNLASAAVKRSVIMKELLITPAK
jgi:hypothetical protein